MIFCSDFALKRLANSPIGMVDGTFKQPGEKRKKLFAQLLSIHGQHGQHEKVSLPCVYIFLPNKEQNTYENALREVLKLVPNLKIKTWMCDYEHGLRNAIITVFGGTVVGCNFHFSVRNSLEFYIFGHF